MERGFLHQGLHRAVVGMFIPEVQLESQREIHRLRGEPIPEDIADPEDDAYVEAVEDEVEKEYDVIIWYTRSDTIRVKAHNEDEAHEKAAEEFYGEIDDYEVEEVPEAVRGGV